MAVEASGVGRVEEVDALEAAAVDVLVDVEVLLVAGGGKKLNGEPTAGITQRKYESRRWSREAHSTWSAYIFVTRQISAPSTTETVDATSDASFVSRISSSPTRVSTAEADR